MNTDVSFLLSQLLKEKGFDEKCSHYYINDFQKFKHDGKLYKTGLPNDWDNDNILQFVKRTNQPHLCNAPTIAQVVMWLYEKHGIWIVCTPFYIAEGKRFSADVFSADNKKTSISHYKTPTEAYSFAIEHVLNNLI